MTTFTEGRHTAEFILSEANGHRSRQNGTIKTNQDLAAGTVLELDETGDLIAFTGAVDSDGDLITQAAGILLAPMNTTSTGTNADTAGSYIARDAEVNGNLLTYPTETLAGEEALANTSLGLLGIQVR